MSEAAEWVCCLWCSSTQHRREVQHG